MTTYHAMLAAPARRGRPGHQAAPVRGAGGRRSGFHFRVSRHGVGPYRYGGACRALDEGSGGDHRPWRNGAYILDKVAKTPVPEIRLFDADEFLNHNAFRAPGAASLEELREAPLKVDYFKRVYSRMHRWIIAHPVELCRECPSAGRRNLRLHRHG